MSWEERNRKKSVTAFLSLLLVFVLLGTGFVFFATSVFSHRDEPENNSNEEIVERVPEYEYPLPEEGHPALSSNLVQIVEDVGPAVVKITTIKERVVYDFFMRQYRQEVPAEGSGVIFQEEGYILTNNHVIAGSEKIMVTLPGVEEEYEAEIIGRDAVTDLAVIKIEGRNLPTATLGDSDNLRVGEVAIAIGNPYGLSNTVTVGVISALDRRIAIEEGTELTDVIQTDAAINHGNSGGPLINGEGEVVGINTAIIRGAQGLGFAIPVNTAREISDELIEHGRIIRPWLGIYGGTVTPAIARQYELPIERGVYVQQVVSGSPAHNAGIVAEDLIIGFEDVAVESFEDLTRELYKRDPKEEITITIYRDGEEKELEVQLEPSPES